MNAIELADRLERTATYYAPDLVTLKEAARLLREMHEALGLMLREHDILSGNFDVIDPKHKRPDRWPTAAEAARRAYEGKP